MYENLRAELARKNKTIEDLAADTGIRYQTLALKLRGGTPFKLSEAMQIKKALDVDMPIEELFGVQVTS